MTLVRYRNPKRVTWGYRFVRHGRLYKHQGFPNKVMARDAENAHIVAVTKGGPALAPYARTTWEEAVARYGAARAAAAGGSL